MSAWDDATKDEPGDNPPLNEIIDFKAALDKFAGNVQDSLKKWSDEMFVQTAAGTLRRLQRETAAAVSDMTRGVQKTRALDLDLLFLHSEVSEAFEEWRQGRVDGDLYEFGRTGQKDYRHSPTNEDSYGKPVGVGAELADVFIRLLDLCDRHGYDLWEQYERVMNYNRGRNWPAEGKRT